MRTAGSIAADRDGRYPTRMQSSLWMLALAAAGLYCLARGIVDLRARRYGWALAGLVSAAAILTVPIPSHAVKIDLAAPR